MSTPNRTEINQANAQHSTGPKTEAGKHISSLNALKHGLSGQLVVLPTEDLVLYESHKKSFLDEYHPKSATESHLVQAMADASWRLSRVAALETNLLTLSYAPAGLVAGLEAQSRTMANLSLHSQRLSRQFEKAAEQLRDLQKSRLYEESRDMDKLLNITEMFEERGETYKPSENGFVFSQAQINRAIQARDRERLYDESLEEAA
jgi:hypothetical protein